ncbi:MAG: TonB family protein [Bacteroidota bacterium]
MDAIIDFMYQMGSNAFELFWLPLLLWTALALIAESTLHVISKLNWGRRLHPIYQYHTRVATLLALPAGLLLTLGNHFLISSWSPDVQAMVQWIEIQTPVMAAASSSSATTGAPFWTDLTLLSGLIMIGTLALGSVAVFIMTFRITQLYNKSQTTESQPLTEWQQLHNQNRSIAEQIGSPVTLQFSNQTTIPYTFGWKLPHIVLPINLQDEPEKANLVIRHELTHIQQRDYPINTLLLIIRSLFVMHPLVHLLHRNISYWREISCDAEVLSDTTISTRLYANLLLELATNEAQTRQPMVTMAAHSSTLKQRITDMKYLNKTTTSMKRSFTLLALGLFMISGIMACSDIQDGGITAAELEETRSQLNVNSHSDHQHQVSAFINGQPVEGGMAIISRIKEGYIKEVNVMSAEKAKENFGIEVNNSKVINLIVHDREMALNDLLSEEEMKQKREAANAKQDLPSDTFVMVDQMPELKGGLKSIMENVEYPTLARKAGIEGRVFIQFVVNEQGKVTHPKVVKGIGAGCDEEALRAVKQAEFTPGYQDGKPVKVKFSLPVMFKLPDEAKTKS